jgi:hypothetical protein
VKCIACNQNLNDHEQSLKEADTATFIDLCGQCYSVSERATNNYDIDASDFDVEFNDGIPQPQWLQ